MSLLDIFKKPRWKHEDPEVRAEAVRRMEVPDASVLAELAKLDTDVRVRRAAVKRIADPQVLADIAESETDAELKQAAGERASDLLAAEAMGDGAPATRLAFLDRLTSPRAIAEVAKHAALEPLRRTALERLTDSRVLADVARKGADPGVRTLAVERIAEESVLREIALTDPVKEVSAAAVGRLTERGSLEEVARRARSKRARSLARERLEGFAPGPSAAPVAATPEAIRHARGSQLCRTVEAAARASVPDDAVAAVEEAATAFSALELGTITQEEELRARFERARSAFETRRTQVAADREARQLAGLPPVEAPEAPAPAPEAPDHEAADETAEPAAGVAAPATAEPADTARREKERVIAVHRIEQLLANLETAAATDDPKVADRAIRKAEQALGQAKGLQHEQRSELDRRFREARDKAVARVHELREADDWKRWANLPRLEELCAKVEALAEATDLKQVAQELREAQAEWKTLPAPHDKSAALWARFKQAADAAHVKAREHYVALDEQRGENLKKKEVLCDQVEALADSTDWKETTEKIQRLQEEWKAIGPAPREQAGTIWSRFRGACDRFFDRRKQHFLEVDAGRSENLKRREELCARVAALADSTEWASTAELIKKAQVEWKTIGPAPHKAGEDAWNRFRASCDRFFERRKAHFEAADNERLSNLKQKEDLCVAVEALLEAVDTRAAADQVREHMATWKTIGPAPREQSEAVWNRFRDVCDKVRDRAGDKAPGPGRDPGRDSSRDSSRDSGRDSGRDSSRDSGRDSSRGSNRGGGRDSGRDSRDSNRDRSRRSDDRGGRRGEFEMPPPAPNAPQFRNSLPLEEFSRRLREKSEN